MKKLAIIIISSILFLMMPQATAANTVIRLTAPVNQTFTGEFRNDDLAQLLTPSGDLGRALSKKLLHRFLRKSWL